MDSRARTALIAVGAVIVVLVGRSVFFGGGSESGPKPKDTSINSGLFPGWAAYSSAEGRFSLVAPKTVRASSPGPAQVAGSPAVTQVQFVGGAGNAIYSVAYFDVEAGSGETGKRFLADYGNKVLGGMDGRIKHQRLLSVYGHTAVDAIVRTPDRVTLVRIVAIGTRFYQITGSIPPHDRELRHQADTFLSSFRAQQG